MQAMFVAVKLILVHCQPLIWLFHYHSFAQKQNHHELAGWWYEPDSRLFVYNAQQLSCGDKARDVIPGTSKPAVTLIVIDSCEAFVQSQSSDFNCDAMPDSLKLIRPCYTAEPVLLCPCSEKEPPLIN